MLRQLGVKSGSSVLDPWNGTGTTTSAARSLGARSTGVDINPVLDTVARSKLADQIDARVVLQTITVALQGGVGEYNLEELARLYNSIAESDKCIGSPTRLALAMCCMFPLVRQLFSLSKTRNPSWFSSRAKPDCGTVLPADAVLASAARICDKFNTLYDQATMPRIILGDIKSHNLGRAKYDFMLTSPPYLTRVDYVKATLPELTLMSLCGLDINVEDLRHKMIGTPLTTEIDSTVAKNLPPPICTLLKRIETHTSKASSTYYKRFYYKYFTDMWKSFNGISKRMKSGALICVVVQPSFYKEVFVDLPALMIELLVSFGFLLEEVIYFDAKNSMAAVNKRANPQAAMKAVEAAIIMRQGANR